MSSTNKTVTIELSQYVGTDKPTYLTDYNGDMLKIDNAIAADRDAIDTAQAKANEADGKADDNASAIQVLDEAINGDPEVPSQPSISSRLTNVEGSVNTLNTLVGDGTHLATGQTLVSSVNGIEDLVAPREDEATLGASYAIDAQFIRGAVLYKALTALTAGTAFSSLVLNTDYAVSDKLVDQLGGGTPTPGTIAADDVTYDNTTSGLSATNAQDAIDEIKTMIPSTPPTPFAPTNVSESLTDVNANITSPDVNLSSNGYLASIEGSFTVSNTINANTKLFTIPTEHAVLANSAPFIMGKDATVYKAYVQRNGVNSKLTDVYAGEAISAGSVRFNYVYLWNYGV